MKIKVNRAPVLTLWAAVVAERMGHSEAEALTLGKALAGLNAQSKGRRLGIYAPRPKTESVGAKETTAPSETVELMGRQIPVVRTRQGMRAADKGEAMEPASVRRYLESKFGDHLADVQQAMSDLAKSYPSAELPSHAFGLYEKFRPQVPQGERGWGAAGDLDLALLRKLRKGAAGK
jgi:type IV secretory pathway TrbL component